MSETECHQGVLRDITDVNISLEEHAKKILNDKGKTELNIYNDTWIDQFIEEQYREYDYIIINNKMYKFIKHQEFDPESINFSEKLGNGDIEFMVSFYNGGCSFDEALEELIQ